MKHAIQMIVCFALCFVISCSSDEYTGIEIKEFPEEYKQYDCYAWEMLELDDFARAYDKMLKDFPRELFMEDFVLELGLVNSGNKFVSTDQGNFIYISGCKPHFCITTMLYALYDPQRNIVWAFLSGYDHSSDEHDIWLGQPDTKTRTLFDKVYELARH